MEWMPNYEKRVQNPHFRVLDFELLNAHPEAKFAIWQRYQMDAVFRNRIQDLMMSDYAFKETFNFNNFSSYYYKALKDMYFYLKYFMYDRNGIKMFIYKGIDRFTKPNMFRLEAISYHRPLKDVNNYLNLNHQEWCHPCLKREKHNPYQFPMSQFCFDLTKFSNELNGAIDYTFQQVFSISNMSKKYYESLNDMRFALRFFRQDPYGIKKFFYKLTDTFTTKRCFRFEAISYHYPLNVPFDFLNFDHHIWRNPTTYSITSRESFYDLYKKSLKLSKKIIEDTFAYLNGKEIDLTKVYTNLSYITGLDCNEKKELKYFEF